MTDNSRELPFRPRARLLQLIGDQLIGSHRLAVFELVKNAYDADAGSVVVTLDGLETGSPSIIVEDDGEGMSVKTIENIWLVPADDHRERQRLNLERTPKGRLPLGEKGLGRFAVHKLGERIELITRAAGEDECRIAIDWDALIKKPYLSDARVHVATREPEHFKGSSTGTLIRISRLRAESWTRGDVRRLFRQITSICSPFADRSDGFVARLEVPDHPEWVERIPDIDILLDLAPWRYDFRVDENGLDWTYKFRGIPGIKVEKRERTEKEEKLLIPPVSAEYEGGNSTDSGESTRSRTRKNVVATAEMFKGIGPVSGRFYVFDRDPAVLRKLGDSSLIKNFLDENGGVRVYRDGIRVYNYGEPSDDWLGLDLKRVNTPTRNISRNIIVGAIDLSLDQSTRLKEKTNREGFVENDAFERLTRLVLGALGLLQIERKMDKDKIRVLIGKKTSQEERKIEKPLLDLRKAGRKHGISDTLDPLIDRVESNYEEMRDTMLRAGLSGAGLAIVFHEIEQAVRHLYTAIEGGNKRVSVQQQARELVRLLDGFSELLRKGERKQHNIRTLVRRARDINAVRFRKHGVTLVCPALEEGAPEVVRTFSFGLMLGALNNLLDNAFYWLKVRWPEENEKERKIYMNVSEDFPGGAAIVVADNGPGLQDDAEYLLRPFFSRRPDGMGIGLYYSNMAMEMNGGHLTLPAADDADVPREFDGAVFAMTFSKAARN